jgi:hypothetical protein
VRKAASIFLTVADSLQRSASDFIYPARHSPGKVSRPIIILASINIEGFDLVTRFRRMIGTPYYRQPSCG